MIAIDVGQAPAELRAAVLAMKQAGSEIRRGVSARMRGEMNPVWKGEVTQRAAGGMAARLLSPGARITGGNPPQIIAASSRRAIGRGLVPDRNWAGYEYGAHDSARTVKSSKGTRYRRHVMRHLPTRGKGRVIDPAVARILPRIAAYWAQSVVRAFMDAAEGKA